MESELRQNNVARWAKRKGKPSQFHNIHAVTRFTKYKVAYTHSITSRCRSICEISSNPLAFPKITCRSLCKVSGHPLAFHKSRCAYAAKCQINPSHTTTSRRCPQCNRSRRPFVPHNHVGANVARGRVTPPCIPQSHIYYWSS